MKTRGHPSEAGDAAWIAAAEALRANRTPEPGALPSPGQLSPEGAVLAAEVQVLLAAAGTPQPWPEPWTSTVPAVRRAWHQADVLCHPERLSEPLSAERAAAVLALDGSRRADGPALVEAALDAPAPEIRRWGLGLLRTGLRAGWLPSSRAHALLMAKTSDGALGGEVLAELCAPWASVHPTPVAVLVPGLRVPEHVRAALSALVAHGHTPVVLAWLADARDEAPPALAHALRALGPVLGRGEVSFVWRRILAHRGDDALYDAAMDFRVDLHARGIYVQAPELPDLVALWSDRAGADPTLLLGLVAHLAEPLVELLAALDTADPRWTDLVPVLADITGSTGLLVRLIREAPTGVRRAAIAALADPRHAAAEQAVLDVLPSFPEDALATLSVIGGAATRDALWRGLGVDGGPLDRVLAGVGEQATTLLWRLVPEDDPALDVLQGRLQPSVLPPLIRRDLAERPSRSALALLRAVELADGSPRRAWLALCRTGTVAVLPDLVRLLRHQVDALGPETPTPREDEAQDGLDPELVEATSGLGRRLVARGCIRPVELRHGPDGLWVHLVFAALEEPGLPEGLQRVLLERLDGLEVPIPPARLGRYLKSGHPQLRRVAVRLWARQHGGGPRAGFTAGVGLRKLFAADDPSTVRAALEAVAEIRLTALEPLVRDVLAHPNMNLKRTAARTLGAVGTAHSVPALVSWLGQHDNEGFRAELLDALQAITGDTWRPVLLGARDHADGRRRALLERLLPEPPSHQVPRAPVDRDLPAGWSEERLAACLEGPSTREDRAWIAAHRLTLLDRRDAAPDDPALANLLAVAGAPGPSDPLAHRFRDVIVPLARAVARAPTEEGQRGLLSTLQSLGPELSTADRWSLVAVVRGLPRAPTGTARWQALRALGAVPTEPDLRATLQDLRRSAAGSAGMEQLLREVAPGEGEQREALIARAVGSSGEEGLGELLAGLWSEAVETRPARRSATFEETFRAWHTARVGPPPSGWGRRRWTHRAVVEAWLAGTFEVPSGDLARVVPTVLDLDRDDPAFPAHALRWLADRGLLSVDRLWAAWVRGGAHGDAVASALSRVRPDRLVPRLAELARHGDWTGSALVRGPIVRTAEVEAWIAAVRAQSPAEADRLEAASVAPTVLAGGGDAQRRALEVLLASDRTPAAPAGDASAPVDQLLAELDANDPKVVRRALRSLALHPGPAVAARVRRLVTGPDPTHRIPAHRCLRAVASREVYLEATCALLDDPRSEVRRQAIRVLGYADRPSEASLVAILGLLDRDEAPVQRAAEDALVQLGERARRAVERARRRARPDRRWRLAAILERIDAPG